MSVEVQRAYEELLVTLAMSGDGAAWERLAARWQVRLVRTARRLLQDDELARDAVQDAWLAISKGLAIAAGPGAVFRLGVRDPSPALFRHDPQGEASTRDLRR